MMGGLSRLFPDDDDLRMSHMADAYAYRSLWDLRWYTIKLYVYSLGFGVGAGLGVSLVEHVFHFSLVGWLLGL